MATRIRIRINMDGAWAGDGWWVSGQPIWNCPAVLGADTDASEQDASDAAYEAIEDALEKHDRTAGIRMGTTITVDCDSHRYVVEITGIESDR